MNRLALTLALALAVFAAPAFAHGSKTATMSVSLVVTDACAVVVNEQAPRAPGVTCSPSSVQPIVEQRVEHTATGASNVSSDDSATRVVTVVTY
ncbi:hypothetical protein [Paraburkholderia tropica]|uniref:hypothetical protein n=1 Tax=Paraburkholderia tropica TaxID=92647 RepID=UPI0007EDB20E|nr:hypothetical protein [Paraburkholderia tropica]OBR53731.1 hypothetical protein A6456_12420 [Paraburkholderia tropica]